MNFLVRLLALPFIFIGLLSCWMSLKNFRAQYAFVKSSVPTTATVIGYDFEKVRNKTFLPKLEYSAPGLKLVTVALEFNEVPRVGRSFEILYQPKNPRVIVLRSWYRLWGFPTSLACSGFVALLMGYVLWSRPRRRQRPINQLKRDGVFIMARVIRVIDRDRNQRLMIHGIPSVVVEAKGHLPWSRKEKHFFSPPVWEIPNPMPLELKVFINPRRKSIFHLDVGLDLQQMLDKYPQIDLVQSQRSQLLAS